MVETSARLLRPVSLLQSHREWSGAEPAERLEVSSRTLRRDVERLRALGHPVHAGPGTGGGHQLGAGAEPPPLLLDDDEAVAVAVGLRTAAGQGIEGIGETSVRGPGRAGTGAAGPAAPPGGRPERRHRADAARTGRRTARRPDRAEPDRVEPRRPVPAGGAGGSCEGMVSFRAVPPSKGAHPSSRLGMECANGARGVSSGTLRRFYPRPRRDADELRSTALDEASNHSFV